MEYLRGTGSAVHLRLSGLIESGRSVATTEVVVLEILAGARDTAHGQELRRLLYRCDLLLLRGLSDHEEAARVYCRCREAGVTVRGVTDCLIAWVAIREKARLLHCDRDFDAIATACPELMLDEIQLSGE